MLPLGSSLFIEVAEKNSLFQDVDVAVCVLFFFC